MTLLTFASKLVVQSQNAVTSVSSTLEDDTEAIQTFILNQTQVVLVLYSENNNNGVTNDVHGKKIAINVDGTDYSQVSGSARANFPSNNATFWIGSLAAGSHTIKGRFASNLNATTTTISNRTLLIMVFNGDEFGYITSAIPITNATQSIVLDTPSNLAYTPSGQCRALCLYAASNDDGTTSDATGTEIVVEIDSIPYIPMCRAPSAANGAVSNLSFIQGQVISAQTHSFCGGFLAPSAGTATISRRHIGYLLFNFEHALVDASGTQTPKTTTSNVLIDNFTVTRNITLPHECFALVWGVKLGGTADASTGECVGVEIDTNDRMLSRHSDGSGTGATTTYPTNVVGFYSEHLDDGTHTVTCRMSNNNGTDSATFDQVAASVFWFVYPAGTYFSFSSIAQSSADFTVRRAMRFHMMPALSHSTTEFKLGEHPEVAHGIAASNVASAPDTTRRRYGMRKRLWYQGKVAAYLSRDILPEKTFYILANDDLVSDIINQHPKYDSETIQLALDEDRYIIIIDPEMFAKESNKDKLVQSIKVINSGERIPTGYFKALTVNRDWGK